jgi:hypothetical protein
LWAEKLIRSTFSFSRSIATFPVACAASTWKMIAFARHISPIAAIGWITPISLFTSMIDTTIVSGRNAALNFSRSRSPSGSGSR